MSNVFLVWRARKPLPAIMWQKSFITAETGEVGIDTIHQCLETQAPTYVSRLFPSAISSVFQQEPSTAEYIDSLGTLSGGRSVGS